MNIIIIGAGGVGRYTAEVLAKEDHNVIVVDIDPKRLEMVSWNIDVGIMQGSGTDWQMLDDLLDLKPDFLLALTTTDEVNFTACAIAKHLGYPRTVARISDPRFLNRTRLDFSHIFEIDYFTAPSLLTANDILKYMMSPGSLAVENFAHGAVQMRTLAIPQKWKSREIPLKDLNLPKGVIIGLIKRKMSIEGEGEKTEVIFPHGHDVILPDDEVTFIGKSDVVSELHQFVGLAPHVVKSVVIVGGSLTGFNLARLLNKRGIDVRLIDKDYKRCRELSEQLPDVSVIHQDGTDLDFLKSEKIGTSEVIVACTGKDEVNLLAGQLGKKIGCEHSVVMLTKTSLASLAHSQGISYCVSPKVSASDQILSHIFSGTISSLVSLHENKAEILEVQVSSESELVGIPIKELGTILPQDFLIAIIENRGRIMVAHGDRIISPGDSVIVITSPKHVQDLEKIF